MVSVPIAIIILDENDNAPEFIDVRLLYESWCWFWLRKLQAPYDILAQEDAEIGTTIFAKLKVQDKDTVGENLEVECINLPEYQNSCEFFEIRTIDSSQSVYHGALVLNKKVNYTVQQKHQFLLKATVSC